MSGRWKPLKEALLDSGGVENNGWIAHPDCPDDTIYLFRNAMVYEPDPLEVGELRLKLESEGKTLVMIKNLGVE